ncbi:hypothetical protein BVRB_4g083060 [Beta vulgaris subsp. vulgaris]|nr:hypothetical protein BVRB_4g083060 [Beta vulgaris subsp. vulgaris]
MRRRTRNRRRAQVIEAIHTTTTVLHFPEALRFRSRDLAAIPALPQVLRLTRLPRRVERKSAHIHQAERLDPNQNRVALWL